MFLKLVKHEFRSTRKGMLIMMVMILVMCVINFFMPMILRSDLDVSNGVGRAMLISVILFWTFLYMVVLIGVSITANIFVAIRFYRSMFTHEGYLTHTLPVSHHQLLWSKTLVSYIWLELLGLLMALTAGTLAIGLVKQTAPLDVQRELAEILGYFLKHFTLEIILFVVAMLLAPLAFILCIYACLALGQRFHNKVLASILIFVGFLLVYGLINSVSTVMIQQIAAERITSYMQSAPYSSNMGYQISQMLNENLPFLFNASSLTSIVRATIWGLIGYLILAANVKKHLNLD